MNKIQFKKLIKECFSEILTEYHKGGESDAKSLKIGCLVLYNDQGPFKIENIRPINEFENNLVFVKMSPVNNPEKWVELRVDKNFPIFKVVKRVS